MFKHQKEQLNNVFIGLMSNINLKIYWSTILGVLTYLTGCEEKIISALFILILIDTVFGLAVSIKKKKFSSWNGLSLALFKIFIYLGTIVAVNQAEIMGMWEVAGNIILFLIASTELISILECSAILGFKKAQLLIDKINDEIDEKLNKN